MVSTAHYFIRQVSKPNHTHMEKIDLAKVYKSYYTAKPQPERVTFGTAQYLSIQGKGDPSGADFSTHIQALYGTAYTLKFQSKQRGMDFVVPKLEGLWWYDEAAFQNLSMLESVTKVPRHVWEYRLLLRMPDVVTEADLQEAILIMVNKKGNPMAKQVKWFTLTEGDCVQMLHVGPFSTEPETLVLMNDFMEAHGLHKNGLHHEIYLSDFNKTAPEKHKTILREPIA